MLHSAVTNGRLEMVKYLVKKGADVNDKDIDGWRVLHDAAGAGELQIVKYLVEQGTDTTVKSKIDSHTLDIDILKIGAVKNSVVLINLLLAVKIVARKAVTLFVEGKQMSILEWSIYFGHDEITTILKRSIKHRS